VKGRAGGSGARGFKFGLVFGEVKNGLLFWPRVGEKRGGVTGPRGGEKRALGRKVKAEFTGSLLKQQGERPFECGGGKVKKKSSLAKLKEWKKDKNRWSEITISPPSGEKIGKHCSPHRTGKEKHWGGAGIFHFAKQ